MKRIIGPVRRLADMMRGRRSKNSPSAQVGVIDETAAYPLAKIHRAAEDAAAATERLFGEARSIEEHLADIQGQLGRAWQGQSQSNSDYYALLRGVLLALDDCRALGRERPDAGELTGRLEKVLRDQGVETIPTAEGDPFRPEMHCCEKTEPAADRPPGTILSILAAGYRRRLPSGAGVIVRPARVVVSQSPVESEELKR